MSRLAELLGSEFEAARWKNARVHQLVVWDRLDPNAALDLVEQGVADNDPAILAETGQVWTRRFGADPDMPDVLYLTHWLGLDREHLIAEDGGRTGTGVIPLAALHAYELSYWKRS